MKHELGFWALAIAASNGTKIHTLSRLSFFTVSNALNASICATETATIAVCCLFLVAQTLAPLRVRRYGGTGTSQGSSSQIEVREDETSVLGFLFLAWLGPLLKMGFYTQLESNHLNGVDVTPAATCRLLEFRRPPTLSGLLIDLSALGSWHSVRIMVLNILAAAARLCQPLIIQSLVKFLQRDQNVSIGNWLILAVVLE